MNYDSESNSVILSSVELAAFHLYNRFSDAQGTHGFDILRDSVKDENKVKFIYSFTHRSLEWELRCEASAYANDRLTFNVAAPFVADDDKLTLFTRANAFLCAFACMMITDKKKLELDIVFESNGTEVHRLPIESVSLSTATKFFKAAIARISSPRDLGLELTDRASLRTVKFPYKQMRDAQREFISQCYNAIKRERRLYVCAPTGVGKTVSVLFPALRALGNSVIDKIFYLTPRGITNNSAAEAVGVLFRGGAKLRAVEIVSKEKYCTRGLLCKTVSGCGVKKRKKSEYTSAALELFSRRVPFMSSADVSLEAKQRGLCAHELALAYSELCDVIICDYNYLFDPTVAFLRYFEGKNGRYCFLVDEAHNLPERARELYSTRITPDFFDSLSNRLESYSVNAKKEQLRERLLNLSLSLRKLYDAAMSEAEALTNESLTLAPDGSKHSIYRSSEPMSTLIDRVGGIAGELGELCYGTRGISDLISDEALFELRSDHSRLSEFSQKISTFGSDFDFFIFRDGDRFEFVSYCIDPSRLLSERLALGRSAVFFSGTLYPIDFFKRILGGTDRDFTCEFESPYDTDRLAIVAYDGVGTRYSERKETLFDVANVIYATVMQRRGNYLVFAPSYAYMRDIYGAFKAICGSDVDTVIQKEKMTPSERVDFLLRFSPSNHRGTVGFCVLGGLFSESLNLSGDALIGSIVVGVALPRPSPFTEAIREYFEKKYEEGFEFAYLYPSAEKIFQAGGRVIRSENDRGVLVLIDSRYNDPRYKKLFPEHWHGLKFTSDTASLSAYLRRFWES